MAPAAAWRPMLDADLAKVVAVAARVHPAFPEDEAVFAERLSLYPHGCRVLAQPPDRADATILAYAVSHPAILGLPPPLNSRLGALPENADTFYIHDLAVLPEARGTGAARVIVSLLAMRAKRDGLACMSLVAVNGSSPFWERMGFSVSDAAGMAGKLASYGADARLMVRPLG